MSSADGSSNAGQSAGNAIKQGAAKIHVLCDLFPCFTHICLHILQGIGEAIRGNINTFADSATGTDSTKSRTVAERGEQEFETGKYAGTGAGVTPHDTERERLNRDIQGEGNTFAHGTTTGSTTTGVENTLGHGAGGATGRTL
jgi:hypothetical protein